MFRNGIRSTHPCHTNSDFPRRSRAIVAVAAAIALLATGSALAAPPKGGAANIAMIGEPQTLDPMASTADLVGIITQHVYELLYTFDANWNVTPMLAESMPVISKDGLVYTIPLRKGVRFHNGKEMTSDDVVASLKRWMDTAPRGKAVAKEIKSLEAKGPNSIVITLNRPYAPLLAHLALPNGFAAIMAKDSIATPLTQFIGTGPYMFKERKPDQYVQLVRFDGYSARKEPAERLCRQARGAARRAALRAGTQCEHARRGNALGAVPVRGSASGRIVFAARGQRRT